MKNYADIDGDGGSRVVEQVLALREMIKVRLAGVRRIVAIASGKGGVGKSTMTMQLGAALSANDHRVTLLDLDFNGPSLARLAGLQDAMFVPGTKGLVVPQTATGLGVFSFGSIVAEDSALELDSVAPNESHTWRATKEFAILGQILSQTEWGELDYLLLDLPPGAERMKYYAEYFGPAVDFVLVTIPSDLARGVVRRSLAALENMPNRVLGVVENMAGYYCADCDKVQPLFPESDRVSLELPVLGRIPFDPALAASCDAGSPSTLSGSPATAAIVELAQKIKRLGEESDEVSMRSM